MDLLSLNEVWIFCFLSTCHPVWRLFLSTFLSTFDDFLSTYHGFLLPFLLLYSDFLLPFPLLYSDFLLPFQLPRAHNSYFLHLFLFAFCSFSVRTEGTGFCDLIRLSSEYLEPISKNCCKFAFSIIPAMGINQPTTRNMNDITNSFVVI